jgi:hypothetical protein
VARFDHPHGSAPTLSFIVVSDGNPTALNTFILDGNFPQNGYWVRVRMQGSSPITWLVRVWPSDEPENGDHTEEGSGQGSTSPGPAIGDVAMRATRISPDPMVVRFDDVRVCTLEQ